MKLSDALTAYREKFNDPIVIPHMLPADKWNDFAKAVEHCIVTEQKFNYMQFYSGIGLEPVQEGSIS